MGRLARALGIRQFKRKPSPHEVQKDVILCFLPNEKKKKPCHM